MGSTNECKWQALTSILSKGGHVSDLALEYFQGLVATRYPAETPSPHISDLMKQLFDLEGLGPNRTDGAYEWLKAEGAAGDHINELWNDYWCNVAGGGGGGAFDDGFSDGFG
jgi:hypothetical protein